MILISLTKIVTTLFIPLFVFFAFAENPVPDSAKQIVLKGNSKGALACMTCHQENGAGMVAPGFPQLAGMNPFYFSKQIADFTNGQRINPIMQPIAKGLSEKEVKDLAAYFASLSVVKNTANQTVTNAATLEEGQFIANNGLWHKGIPACFACHGPQGEGVGENFPSITTQGKLYLTAQLQAWKKGTRKNDSNQLMSTIAKKLTVKEMNAVTEYLSQYSSEVKK